MSSRQSTNGYEVIHGVAVHDTYRWLEDRESRDTRAWIARQQKRFDKYCSSLQSLDDIRARVRDYLAVETLDQPVRIGSLYFYRRRLRFREQGCICVGNRDASNEQILVDPRRCGRFASVRIHNVSRKGSLLAYELRDGGSDAAELYFVDVAQQRTLRDRLGRGHNKGIVFTPDEDGFYYVHEPAVAENHHAIRFHRFGSRRADPVVRRFPRSAESSLILTSDDAHLVATYVRDQREGLVAELWTSTFDCPSDWVLRARDLPSDHRPLLVGGRLYAFTLDGGASAALSEICEPGPELRTVVPPQKESVQHLVVTKDSVVTTHLHGWGMFCRLWTLSGEQRASLGIPTDGTIRILPLYGSESLFLSYESFTCPPEIYELQSGTASSELWHKQIVPRSTAGCKIRCALAESRDGTKVPLLIGEDVSSTHGKLKPTIMTAYGGFGSSLTSQYSPFLRLMLEFGCNIVLARVRGGREFGKEWHDAGRRLRRQSSIDDFVAVAEWLCVNGVTARRKLGIVGASNGGLLVGAALTQRPELFGAVLCIAPLLDMIRYETFDRASRWRREYGSVENAADFRALHAYSPYHHIETNINYPPVLLVSGDRDDRCNPAHARKMAAALQQRRAQRSPILLEYSHERGHSPVLPLSIRIDSLARRIAFLCQALRVVPQKDPKCSRCS